MDAALPDLEYDLPDLSCTHFCGEDSVLEQRGWPVLGRPVFGAFRRVYALAEHGNKVLKLEDTRDRHFCNVREWQLWKDLRYSPLGRWLAPCLGISVAGSTLLMARTVPLEEWPDGRAQMLPSVFSDVKPGNFGWLHGRLVCHDYASTLIPHQAAGHSSMVLATSLPGDHDYDPEELAA